ncbi:MAG: YbaK/EbsC family protein [Bacteroidota bacterium]|nr:MAG: YbaK/EbsC family protein [Bacteroidota bacterium]
MPAKRIKEFLDNQGIKYYVITHSMAFTAQEIAASVHISGYELAKTVIIRVKNKLAMAVLPATYKVNFKQLAKVVGTEDIALAHEQEFQFRFPECEVGAMPPFGNLWNMDVYVAEKLARNSDIVFNAGSHTELIRMSFADFERLVNPKVLSYAI